MFELKNLRKEYKMNKATTDVYALNGINLKLGDLGFVAIIGKSGSGKTTLMNIIGGIDNKFQGEACFNGKNIANYSAKELDNYRNNEVAFIFQEYNLLNDYSVLENVKLAVSFQETDDKIITAKALDALDKVGLVEFSARKIKSLSGGQQQRVAIARALAKDSKMILCDEPTGNLDSETAKQVIETLKLVSTERLVVVVTHDQDIALSADRVIKIKDGSVVEDKFLNEKLKIENSQPPKETLNKEKYGGMKFKASFSMILNNIRNCIFSSMFITILLTATFALITVFLSLSKYDSQKSFIETLKQNQQYVVQLVKYSDKPNSEVESTTQLGEREPEIEYSGSKIEDIVSLKKENPNASFYPSYFFNKNLQDFSDKQIYSNEIDFQYQAKNFRELIVVEDFSTFHQPILFGSLPTVENEVAIYDYMAYSLIVGGVCEGEIENLVKQTLTDKQSGLKFKISAILKSDYANYSYVQDKKDDYGFEETYLTSLQSIFCFPEMLENLQAESDLKSIFGLNFYNQKSDESIISVAKKLKCATAQNYNIFASSENYLETNGIILSKNKASEILNIGVEELTPENCSVLLNDYLVEYYCYVYDYSVEKSYILNSQCNIIAISDDVNDANEIYTFYEAETNLSVTNSSFRQIYVALTPNWNENASILQNFVLTKKSQEFYANNPNYSIEGYTDYTACGIIVRDADYYLTDVKGLANIIMLVLSISATVGIILFVFMSIKKYGYKIGVLKSLGAKNFDIALVFGLQLIMISLVSILLSIPFSYALMNSINGKFVGEINSGLVFFFIQPTSFFVVALISLCSVLLSLTIPLIKLGLSSPVSIIRNNNRK